MAKSVTYTNGVIAAKENSLLKDKIFRLCESSAEEVLRALQECGFGRGMEVTSVYEYETLLLYDERELDDFIRVYSPAEAEKEYLLSPRDFHNAKAVVKAQRVGIDAGEMLSPDGIYSAEEITSAIKSGNLSILNGELAAAVNKVNALCEGEESGAEISGADIGWIFEKALFERLSRVCKRNLFLKKLISAKADMLNIMTAFRTKTPEYAANNYVCGGKLNEKRLEVIFSDDEEKILQSFSDTPYSDFVKKCVGIKEGAPLTEAEKYYDSFENRMLAAKKYELKRSQPFLYYVFRRRAENLNVRILFGCILSGMDERDIKARLREC